MNGGKIVLTVLALAVSSSAIADQPRAVPGATVCSLSGSICATRGPAGVTIWRKLPGGRKKSLWRANTRGENLQVANDGLSLVEIQPWANLVERDAGPSTTIFTFYHTDGPPIRVSLGEMIRDVRALPRTVSHRNWARTFGYDGLGNFQVDTVEGRRILFNPKTGRVVSH